MKKVIAVLVLCLMAAPGFAGIGFHFNYDATTIDGEANLIEFGDGYGGIVRSEMNGLVGGGIDITFGMIPMVDLALSLEAAYGSYDAGYVSNVPGAGSFLPEEETLPYLRAGADLTATYTVLPLPGIGGVFVGAGPSFMAVAPVFSSELILDNVDSASEEVDEADLVDEIQMEFGLHLALGAKLKPTGFPLAFRVGMKYYIIPSLEDPAPGNWLTLQAGIVLGG